MKKKLLKDVILSESLLLLNNQQRGMIMNRVTEHINDQIDSLYEKITMRLHNLGFRCIVENKYDDNFNIVYIMSIVDFDYQIHIKNHTLENELTAEYVCDNMEVMTILVETNDDFNRDSNEYILTRKAFKELFNYLSIKISTDYNTVREMNHKELVDLYMMLNSV